MFFTITVPTRQQITYMFSVMPVINLIPFLTVFLSRLRMSACLPSFYLINMEYLTCILDVFQPIDFRIVTFWAINLPIYILVNSSTY